MYGGIPRFCQTNSKLAKPYPGVTAEAVTTRSVYPSTWQHPEPTWQGECGPFMATNRSLGGLMVSVSNALYPSSNKILAAGGQLYKNWGLRL
nr:hypothetical protein Iba_chr08fCG0110 [Ipomoea batatas]